MAKRLPTNPNLQQYRKQAKDFVKAHQAGDSEAFQRIQQSLSRLAGANMTAIRSADFPLSDAQWIIAREHGFESWPKFKRHIESRSQRITQPTGFAARQSEAGAIANALSRIGVSAPHSGQPYSDTLLFGIGGGITVGYFVFVYPEFTSLSILTRIAVKENPKPVFQQTICQRIGVKPRYLKAPSKQAAREKLDKELDAGNHPVVWSSPSQLPYYGERNFCAAYHTFMLDGVDDRTGRYRIADRSSQPVTMSTDELMDACISPMAPKFRGMVVSAPKRESDIKAAVTAGIQDCRTQVLEGWDFGNFKGNFGVAALEKWARLIVDRKDKKGWPRLFPRGGELFSRLVSVFDQIEVREDGSALRNLYADFLDEAGDILSSKTLPRSAGVFRESATLWSELARCFLPDAVPEFKTTRELLLKKRALFLTKGDLALPQILEINQRLEQIKSRMADSFPLDDGQVDSLLASAATQLKLIQEFEKEAFEELSID